MLEILDSILGLEAYILVDFLWLCMAQRISLLRSFNPNSVMGHRGLSSSSVLCQVTDIWWGGVGLGEEEMRE